MRPALLSQTAPESNAKPDDLVSIYPQDLPCLAQRLEAKLRLFGFYPGVDARSKVSAE